MLAQPFQHQSPLCLVQEGSLGCGSFCTFEFVFFVRAIVLLRCAQVRDSACELGDTFEVSLGGSESNVPYVVKMLP